MVLKKVWDFLEEQLLSYPSTSFLFNHYRDNISDLDLPHGNLIRLKNLYNYIQSFPQKPSILILGEAPGIKGCRFSGVPFTSERQLVENKLPFKGNQSSKKEVPFSENTATIFWNIMLPYFPYFFIWNCIPFHPHENGNYTVNRTPSKKEISCFTVITNRLIDILQPDKVIALGRNAEYMLKEILNISCIYYVRHPSYGGKREFQAKIKNLLA
jgi:hypothetical protein